MKRKYLIPAALMAMMFGMPDGAYAQEGEEPSMEPGATERTRNREVGATHYQAKLGGGYDSNVYQAPGGPYVDYYAGQLLGGGVNPVVVPQRKTGLFLPYEFRVQSSSDRKDNARTLASAKVRGRFYPASSSRAGSEFTAVAHGGRENLLARDGKKEDTLYYGALVRRHQQTYVDHDTGLPKTTTVSGTSIANRYNHTDFGAEISYRHETNGANYGLRGQVAMKQYADPVVVAALDHTFMLVGGDTTFKLGTDSKLNLDASYSQRNYSARHAHDAQGVYAVANPLLTYSFIKLGAKLDHRISAAWSARGEYQLIQRTDHFVNYNDFTEHKVEGKLHYRQDDFRALLALGYLTRKYPNAFAFDTLGQPAKTYSGVDARVKTDWKVRDGGAYWAELLVRRRNTTDSRFAYSRSQIMAGRTWNF